MAEQGSSELLSGEVPQLDGAVGGRRRQQTPVRGHSEASH